jgi:hypothetical protein
VRLIFLLLAVAGSARADKIWLVERGQALVSIEAGPRKAPLSAVSLGLTGLLRELESGLYQADVRLTLSSFTTGSVSRDQRVREGSDAALNPEIVFSGVSLAAPEEGAVRLRGTLTLLGQSRALEIPLSLVRAGGSHYAHASFALHLRDFGVDLPAAADEVRVDLDAGLRPAAGAVASR